jgi:hypothetical protein
MLFIGGLAAGGRLAAIISPEHQDAAALGTGLVFAAPVFFLTGRKHTASAKGLPVVSGVIPNR